MAAPVDHASRCGKFVVTLDNGEVIVRTVSEAIAVVGTMLDAARRRLSQEQLRSPPSTTRSFFEARAASLERAIIQAQRNAMADA